MSGILFANNAGSVLATGISSSATQAVLSPGTGSLFPNPSSGQYFVATLVSQSNPAIREIVKVTNISGDTITAMVRAQENTSALSWNAGDYFQLLVTAGSLEAIEGSGGGVTIPNAPLLGGNGTELISVAVGSGLTLTDGTLAATGGASVPISGGTMTGPLILSGDPTVALGAATMQYVAEYAASTLVPLAGGTMTGPLILSGAPTQANQAATMAWVEAEIAAGAGGSPQIIYLSREGITSDAINGLEYGVAAPSGTTGQEAAINAAITAGIAAAEAAGATGLKVIWDVAVALGGPIFLYSNMTIECPNYACGAILRPLAAGSGVPLLRVNGAQNNMGGGTGTGNTATQNTFGQYNPAYSSSGTYYYYRVFNPTYTNIQNVRITGGTWNGNQPGNHPRTPNSQSSVVPLLNVSTTGNGANVGFPSIMEFRGVYGLTLDSVRAFLGILFGLYFINCGNVTLINPDVDNVNDMNYDNDAIHFNGPCDRIRIYSPRVHCADDCIAINADDANFNISAFGNLVTGAQWAAGGPITDVMIEDMVVWPGRQAVTPWGGICFRSTINAIDNVIVRGIQGVSSNWGIWAPQYYTNIQSAGGTSGMLVPGPGAIGRIVLEDVTFDMTSLTNAPAVIAWGLNTESLTIRGRNRINAQVAGPDIFVGVQTTINQLEILDYKNYQPAGATIDADAVLQISGVVNTLNLTGSVYRDPSLAVASAPNLLVTTFTPTSAQGAFPYSGSTGGVIGTAKVDMDANSITNFVNVVAGAVTTIRLAGQHYTSGGGSPLANAGTITNFILGSGVYPLLYYSTEVAAYTGTAPANAINTYTEAVASTATVQTPAIGVDGASLYLQGTYAGATPASGTATLTGGSAVAMTGFTASGGRWNAVLALTTSTTTPADSVTVNLNTGASATSPGPFNISATGATVNVRASFIPGTTGFATTLGAYTGSSNGDTGNNWTINATNNTVGITAIQPVVNSAGGGVTHGPLPNVSNSGGYYHSVTNIGVVLPTSGWKVQMTDLNFNSDVAHPIIQFHMWSDTQATVTTNQNSFALTINFDPTYSWTFANIIGGTSTTITTGTSTAINPTVAATYTIINNGTTVTWYYNSTAIGSCNTSAISSTLTGGSFEYVGWTCLSNVAGQTLTYSFTSYSVTTP
jgi:hypothetical protein